MLRYYKLEISCDMLPTVNPSKKLITTSKSNPQSTETECDEINHLFCRLFLSLCTRAFRVELKHNKVTESQLKPVTKSLYKI